MENTLLEIINNGEDSYTEFKFGRAHIDSLAKEMVAFANTAGGKIYLGIEDNGEITGVEAKRLFTSRKIRQRTFKNS